MNLYLYEIIEDYKNAGSKEEQNKIFQSFCTSVWSSSNKRRTRTNRIRFSVRKDLQDTATGHAFLPWTAIEYNGYISRTKDTSWCGLIRQKVNNLYTRYFDHDVILNKDYIGLLHTPKQLYFQWENGRDISPEEVTSLIQNALAEADIKKNFYQKQKMDLSWIDYKKITEGFLHTIFQTCRLAEDYGEETRHNMIYDFMNEDNFYIRYFCRSLEYTMKKWEKQYYGLRDHKTYTRCTVCGRLIEKTSNRIKYCRTCAVAVNREKTRINAKSKRMFDLEKS